MRENYHIYPDVGVKPPTGQHCKPLIYSRLLNGDKVLPPHGVWIIDTSPGRTTTERRYCVMVWMLSQLRQPLVNRCAAQHVNLIDKRCFTRHTLADTRTHTSWQSCWLSSQDISHQDIWSYEHNTSSRLQIEVYIILTTIYRYYVFLNIQLI